MQTIASFAKAEDAHNLRAFLAGSGITAFVRDENILAVDPLYSNAIGGVKIDVGDQDYEESVALIKSVSHSDPGAFPP